MHTETSDHETEARLADTPARIAPRKRHPRPIATADRAAGSAAPSPRIRAASPSGGPATTGYTFRTWNRLHQRDRRIHIGIAIALSVAAHVGLVLSGEGPKPVAVAKAQPAQVVEVLAFDMPEPEETPVEIEASEPADTAPAEFAPPMQADLPSFVTVDSFLQPLQPPVPAGISMDANMLQVPTTVGVGTGKAAPKLFEITELDRVPRRIRTGQPHYPQEFLRARIEGDVQLLVVIDTSGRVRVASVLETTHPEFTRAAISAAQQSLYEPPIKGGVAVSAQYTLRVPFRLNAKD